MKKITKGLIALTGILGIQKVRSQKAVEESKQRLQKFANKSIELSYGQMSYLDIGQGEVILSLHGIFGGYDQGYVLTKNFKDTYRLLCPSRFGYLGSDIKGAGTPAEQASALVELLDALEINKVFVYGISAGGTSAIRFALDYPERVKGLILHCSAMPYLEKQESEYQYNPSFNFLLNDYAMYIMSPFFKYTMGMSPKVIQAMMPIEERKAGIILDASVSNPDMADNFEDYPIESLEMPVIMFQAMDDKIVDYRHTVAVEPRFPSAELFLFESGGHLMLGNEHEIDTEVRAFIEENK